MTGDVLHIQPIHIAQPETPKLFLSELTSYANHRFSCVPISVLLLDSLLDSLL